LEKIEKREFQGKLLVIGGTGFIGGHLVKAALYKGYGVSVISLNKSEPSKAIKGVQYYSVDVSDLSMIKALIPSNKFDYVVNLSGYVDHSSYSDKGKSVVETHLNGMINLIDFLDWNVLKNFVQIGSSDEYGGCGAPQNEEMREQPISPYSFAKVAASHLLQMLGRTERFPSVILRFFLVYGPGQANSRFIPQIIEGCKKNATFETSYGEQLRDFCHVDDIVEGIFKAMERHDLFGEVINLASGKAVQIKYVIDLIQTIIGSGNPEYGRVAYRSNENMALYADITKARKLLAWHPNVSLETGIRDLCV